MLVRMPIRNLKTVTTALRELEGHLQTLLHGAPAASARLAAQPLAEQVKVFERIGRGASDCATINPTFVREVEDAVEQLCRRYTGHSMAGRSSFLAMRGPVPHSCRY